MKEYVEDYGEFVILFLFCLPIAVALFNLANTVLELI